MLKILYSFSLSILLLIGISTLSKAQVSSQGDITAGAGLTTTTGFGTAGSGEIGVNVNGFFSITDEIRAGASLSLFFGDFSPTQFNIDGHYLFINEGDLGVYALAGFGFWSWSFDLGPLGSTSVSTSGLNLGGGVEYDLGSVRLFAEPKLTTIAGTPLNITAGARMSF